MGKIKNLFVRKEKEAKENHEAVQERMEKTGQSITIHPKGCSTMLLDCELGMFDGECRWNGENSLLHLDVDGEGAVTAKAACLTLEQLLAQDEDWDTQARNFAAGKLSETANQWQASEEYEEDEDADTVESEHPVITEEEFAMRLAIRELCISTEGEFELYYDDDGMFLGHVVIVSGHVKRGFMNAEIAG